MYHSTDFIKLDEIGKTIIEKILSYVSEIIPPKEDYPAYNQVMLRLAICGN
jgi:hypothetical protein